jgi:predicted CoA-binding protein
MKIMVMGASPKSYRYSHRVTLMLQENGFEVIPVGIHPGVIGNVPIIDLNNRPVYDDIHTITMYLNHVNQRHWYQYILDLEPKRVIFNPGSENQDLLELLETAGIEYEESCTLVMISTGSFQPA